MRLILQSRKLSVYSYVDEELKISFAPRDFRLLEDWQKFIDCVWDIPEN
jgi:hypothetical protein